MGSIPSGSTKQKRALGLFFVWFSVRKRTRGSPHCAAMARAQNNVRQTACADLREVFPAGVPRRRKAAMSAASSLAAWPNGLRLLFPHICCASVREPYFSRALRLFFVWLSVRKRTRGSSHCAAMARGAQRRSIPGGSTASAQGRNVRRFVPRGLAQWPAPPLPAHLLRICAGALFFKSLGALFCLAFGAEANPRFVPLRSNGTKS